MTYAINMNNPTVQPGRVTATDVDERQRERSAVLEIAEQIDAERRFGIWPPSKPMPLSMCGGPCQQDRRACPSPQACERMPADEDKDGFGPSRGIVMLIVLSVVLVSICAAVALVAARLFGWL
jgi:hypothetical protein